MHHKVDDGAQDDDQQDHAPVRCLRAVRLPQSQDLLLECAGEGGGV